MNQCSPSRSTIPLRLTAAATVFVLAACAQLPAAGPIPQPKSGASLDASASFAAAAAAAPAAAWPVEQWWRAYGDSQLDALIDEAVAGAPDMAAALARLQRADAALRITGAATRPQLRANSSISEDRLSYNFMTPRAATPSGWNDYGRATLDFSWEIDFWGKNRAALAAATSSLQAQGAELANARLLLAASVAADYAELSRLYANRATVEQSVEVRRKTAQLFTQRFVNGLETRGGMREADARRATAEGAQLALDEQIALQRNRLAALLGAGPDRALSITAPDLKLGRGFGLPATLAFDLLGRRPDVTAARFQVAAYDHRVAESRAAFYPNVNLTAFVGVQSLGLDMLAKGGSQVGSIGPAISLPIFDGGRLRGQLRGAEADYAQAVASYDNTLVRALREVADAATSQRSLGARLLKAQEAVDAAAEAHRVARNRYEGGLATYVEVLSAEDGYLTSLGPLTDLRARSITLDIALQRALGGGYRLASQ
jgi:NodT family efflux transporter outer membrane factor (OMF) lipoprotein